MTKEKLQKLIAAGNRMAELLIWIIDERDRPNSNIKSIPRIGIELALEDWEYCEEEILKND